MTDYTKELSSNDNHINENNDITFTTDIHDTADIKISIDSQVVTAHKFPRNLKRVLDNILFLATQDKETADNCFYSVRRDGKTIRGASIRLAEIITACYGNIRASSRILSNDGKIVTAQGMCWDLENNVAFSVEVNRRITDKQGRTFSDDLIVITSNACASIALRNAIFKVVPQAITSRVQSEIKKIVLGEAKDFNTTRLAAIQYFTELGVTEKQILDLFNKKTVEDLDRDDIFDLRGIATAIKEGDTTLESSFSLQPKTNSAIGKASKVLSVPLEEGNAEYEKTNTFQASAIGQEKNKFIPSEVKKENIIINENNKEENLPDIDAFGDNNSLVEKNKFENIEINNTEEISTTINKPNNSIQNNDNFLNENNPDNKGGVLNINKSDSKTETLHIKGVENKDTNKIVKVKIPKIEPVSANFGSDFEVSTPVFTEKENKETKEKKGYKKYIKKADREKLADSESKSNEVVENFNGEKRDELSESDEIKKEVDKKDLFNN